MPDNGKENADPIRIIMEVLSSMRMAIVLLVLIAAAAIVGTLLPDPAAQKYVYGQIWFHSLLGLLGLTIVCCTIWRGRVGISRIWSLLTHAGILLVLVGAMVTLLSAERGSVVIWEGQAVGAFHLEGHEPSAESKRELGFAVRLVDFRIDYYPALDYVFVLRDGVAQAKLTATIGRPVEMPGVGLRLTALEVDPAGMLKAVTADGTVTIIPATAGTIHKLGDGHEVKIIRYEPSFKLDRKTGVVTSDTDAPDNPALQVSIVSGGDESGPQWLFSKIRDVQHREASPPGHDIKLSFFGPPASRLRVRIESPQGDKTLDLYHGEPVKSPFEEGTELVFVRRADRVKEFESEVEVIEEGTVVRRHVIRVNSPLVHKGTRLSQFGYDERRLRWTSLGVSRDKGAGFVYAGFMALIAGLMGRFYIGPVIRKIRSGRTPAGGGDGNP